MEDNVFSSNINVTSQKVLIVENKKNKDKYEATRLEEIAVIIISLSALSSIYCHIKI